MAMQALSSICSRGTPITSSASLDLWKTSFPSSRNTKIKIEKQLVEVKRYFYHSPRKTHHYLSFSSKSSTSLPFSFFRQYHSTASRLDVDSSATCFNVNKPVIGKVKCSNGSEVNQPIKKLPIGIQSITKILSKEEYVYIDKTGFAKELIEGAAPHYFLSRPKSFGKSVFLDTLKEIFKGNKELFRGCQIYNSDYNWRKYPIIYLDFSKMANTTPELLEISLKEALQDVANLYEESISGATSLSQLNRLTTALSRYDPVVILIDEYDKPVIDRLDDLNVAKANRDILKGFFGVLKALDTQLRFTFTTGVSKFSQVSLFSGPNNLRDITMNPAYANLMGYTEEELRQCFTPHIQAIAQQRSQSGNQVTEEEVLEEIRYWYNGYRFSESEAGVYNPFSTLNFMEDKKPKAYWYSSGTPSFLIDQVKKRSQSMVSLDVTTAT